MRELSLHLLDIAENSVSAGATTVEIRVAENEATDRLFMSVSDNGRGMTPDMVARVIDPFTTTRTTRRVGLGIPLLKAAAEACDGYLKIQSEVGKGTITEVEFQRSHIDRMPLGSLPQTILNAVVGWPSIRWIFRYSMNGNEFIFDTEPILHELGDIPLTEPVVLSFLRNLLETGVANLQPDASGNKLP